MFPFNRLDMRNQITMPSEIASASHSYRFLALSEFWLVKTGFHFSWWVYIPGRLLVSKRWLYYLSDLTSLATVVSYRMKCDEEFYSFLLRSFYTLSHSGFFLFWFICSDISLNSVTIWNHWFIDRLMPLFALQLSCWNYLSSLKAWSQKFRFRCRLVKKIVCNRTIVHSNRLLNQQRLETKRNDNYIFWTDELICIFNIMALSCVVAAI